MSDAPAPSHDLWSEDDFALPLSADLVAMTKAPVDGISADKARKILLDRLIGKGADTINAKAQDAQELAKFIVRALPDEALKEQVINSIDLRPYLQVVVDQPGRRFKVRRPLYPDTTSLFETENVQSLLDEQQKQALSTFNEFTGQDGTQIPPYTKTEVGTTPGASIAVAQQDAQTGTIPVADTADAAFDPAGYGAKKAAAPVPTFPEEDLRGITGLPPSGLDDAIQAEIDFNTQQKTPGVQRGGIAFNDPIVGGGPQRGTSSGRKLSYLGARGYLNDLNVNELTDMQDKLAKAGYYDKIGQGPIKGDLNDGATQTAWDLMLVDSFRTNQSITTTMAKRGAEYRQTVIKRNEEAMVKNWQGDTIAAANAMALDQIGRRLLPDEMDQLISMVNGLRTDRADNIIGVDNMSYQTAQTQAKGFDDAEVQRKVDQLVSGERSANASWDAWQGVNDYFGVTTQGNPNKDEKAPGRRTPIVATPPVTPRTHQSINFAKDSTP